MDVKKSEFSSSHKMREKKCIFASGEKGRANHLRQLKNGVMFIA